VTDITEQSAERTSIEPHRSSSRRQRVSAFTVLALSAGAGVAAAAAGCRPTGTPILDPLYVALFASLVTYVCSRASREALLFFSALAVVMSRGWLEAPAIAALLIALASLFLRHSKRRVGALIGALSIETLLRWPPVAFHGSTALVGCVVLVPVSISAYRRVSASRRRFAKQVLALVGTAAVVLSIPLVVAVILTRGDIVRGQHAADAALSDVSNGSSAAATIKLRASTAAFVAASSQLGSWWTSLASVVPVVAQQRLALATGAATARDLAVVAEHVAPSLDYHELRYHQGQVDLGRISAMLRPAQTLDRALSEARAGLVPLRSPWLIGTIQSRLRLFDQSLRRATSSTHLAVRAIPLVPNMLGAQRPQHYFLAFVSPSESRGLDGIVAAYGELTAANGHISLTVSGPVESLNDALPKAGGSLTGSSDFLARYGQFNPGKYFQDATFSPDFPTVARVISQLYPQAGGDQVDGVLMLDPYGLARLLSITGPIKVPGFAQPLTNRNAAGILLKSQYLSESVTNAATQDVRHDVLQDALHITFQRLVSGSLPGPGVLSRGLEPAVLGGRIALWSAHPNDVPLLQALHLEDGFPKVGDGDLLAVTTQNVGANKIDAYLHTSVTDHVTFDPTTGAEHSTVGVTLTNDAPATGLPPIVIDSPSVPKLSPGTNETWLSIYSPLSFDKVTVDGTPSTLSATRELGVWAYSTYVKVASRTSVTVRISLLGRVASGSKLRISVWLQPSANPVRTRVVVTPVRPWGLAASSDPSYWKLGPAVLQERVFGFVVK